MQSRDFCFWLQGFFELSGDTEAITAEQVALIRQHLELVMVHEIAPLAKETPTPRPVPMPVPTPPAPAPDQDHEHPPVVPPEPPRC